MSPIDRFDSTGPEALRNPGAGPRMAARGSGPRPNRRARTYTVWIENARRRELAVLSGRVSLMTGEADAIDLRVALLYDRLRSTPSATVGHHVSVYGGAAPSPNAYRSALTLPVQVGIECVLPPGGIDGIEAFATPDGLAATTEHVGPIELLPDAHAAVRAWCRANGWEVSGTNWEVHGRWSGNPDQWRTAVYYLVR